MVNTRGSISVERSDPKQKRSCNWRLLFRVHHFRSSRFELTSLSLKSTDFDSSFSKTNRFSVSLIVCRDLSCSIAVCVVITGAHNEFKIQLAFYRMQKFDLQSQFIWLFYSNRFGVLRSSFQVEFLTLLEPFGIHSLWRAREKQAD